MRPPGKSSLILVDKLLQELEIVPKQELKSLTVKNIVSKISCME